MRIIRILAATVSVLATAQQADAKDTLKFAIFTPDAELATARILIPWAQRVTAESNGALQIDVYANGALGRNPVLQTKLLQDGIADIVWAVPSYTPGVYPDDSVFELPNVIQNSVEGSVSAWRMLKKGMLRGYNDYYMIGLFAAPPSTLHTSYAARDPKAFNGKKIRVVGTIATESIRAIGAVPEGMPVTQVVEAISRGVINGSTTHPIAAYDFGISRVTNSHFQGRLGSITLGVFMSKASFDRLSPESKAVIEKNRGETLSRAFGKVNEDRNAELLAEWRNDPKRLVTELTTEQTAQWDSMLQPVITNWADADARNKDLLNALRNELQKVRSGN